MSWKSPLKLFWKGVKNPFKKFKLFLKQRLGWLGVPKILPYRGHGNETQAWIKGVVIEDKGLSTPKSSDNIWKNILDMIKRYSGDEIPGVKVKVSLNGIEKIVETDETGHFEATIENHNCETGKWHEVSFELMDEVVEQQPVTKAKGELLIPRRHCEFGIISDIDDTFLISYSTATLKKLRLLLLKNARTRIPFEGVSAFYTALNKGHDENCENPLFYVSSSEWNLYDLLLDFCRINKIPKAPFMLRDLPHQPWKFWKSGKGDHSHKKDKIIRLLNYYPELSFILIGDSGQKDAEIYSEIADEFPERILSIYIRDVSKKKKRDQHILQLSERLKNKEVDLHLVSNTLEAAEKAREKGYIHISAIDKIREEIDIEKELPEEEELIVHPD